MKEKIGKYLRNPSNILVVTFLYLVARYNKIQLDPRIIEVKLRITHRAPSQIDKHIVVELANMYSISFYSTQTQLGLCLWAPGSLCTNQGTSPLINSEINTFNQLYGGYNLQYFQRIQEMTIFINQVKQSITLLETLSHDYVNHFRKDGINISRDHVKFLMENINLCKDYASDMMGYYDNYILPFLSQTKNKISSYPM